MTASFFPCSSLRPSRSRATSMGLATVLLGTSACSVILKPRDDVERCGTAEECSPTGDNRYEPVCKFDDENLDLDSTKIDKICVADFRSIGCDPMGYSSGSGLNNLFLETTEKSSCVDLGCSMENMGKAGCPPPSGEGCGSGLELDDEGFCNDPDADEPIIPPSYLAANDLDDQHVRDQFCKSFFCDDSFVCNSDTKKCQRCDTDRPFGEGGCGLVYSEGEIAKVYVLGDDLEAQCAAEDVQTDEPAVFGDCD
jgi:hypothetical protein